MVWAQREKVLAKSGSGRYHKGKEEVAACM